mmetsp:Transcript_122410/g.341185  ORF Transcript_122410/g.341185 Transcript_122410/m.341185 type:complete len:489 (+) Transcript_122410:61-1527(+)
MKIGAGALPTPQRKRARKEPAQVAAGTVKPLAVRDAKPIVDEIKAKVKGKKFYPGSHAEPRSVHFSTPRFPVEKAEQFLGVGADGKPAARMFDGEQIQSLLRLKPDTLKASLYKKPHRFSKPGATATRWGAAPLKLLSMHVSYKAGCLRGCLRCINAPDPAPVASAAISKNEDAAVTATADTNAEIQRIGETRSERSDLQGPPAVGDTVRILDTPHVRKHLPGCIGHMVTISVDDKSDCPYRVCRNRSEAPFALYPADVKVVAKATAGEPRRILEFSGNKLKILCSDSIAFMNFHRALQTCIQACKGTNAVKFLFEFNGQSISSEGDEDGRFLSELNVGDVVTYASEFNRSYGNQKSMQLTVTGACTVQASAGETPWERPKFLDDGFLPRCIQATSEKTRDTANWRLCHMRFDLMIHPREFEMDDLNLVRLGPDYSSFGVAFSSSRRRRGPGKFRREAVVRRMSLDLAGELDIAQASEHGNSDLKIER